jgi:hypothetical protein
MLKVQFPMEVVVSLSLRDAIEIHARALKKRAGRQAPNLARRRALDLREVGDSDGYDVWLMVETEILDLLATDDAEISPAS